MVAAHDEKLRSLAYHLLGDRDLMDDVLQDVYIKAYVALPGFRRRSSAATPLLSRALWSVRRPTILGQLLARRRGRDHVELRFTGMTFIARDVKSDAYSLKALVTGTIIAPHGF